MYPAVRCGSIKSGLFAPLPGASHADLAAENGYRTRRKVIQGSDFMAWHTLGAARCLSYDFDSAKPAVSASVTKGRPVPSGLFRFSQSAMRTRRDALGRRTEGGDFVEATVAFACLVACACLTLPAAVIAESSSDKTARPTITCSTTQIADFTRQVVGERCTVHCVLAPGQDPHTFEITPDVVSLVRAADLCLDNGLHLEGDDWMRTVAEQEGKPIKSCTDGIPPLVLQHLSKPVKDPHAWFSPQNAAKYVGNILTAVSSIDPTHADEYAARADLYREQLRALHGWTRREINKIPVSRRVLVTSHDAFNYFCKVYGLRPSSPVGWSTQEVGAEVTLASRKLVVDSIRNAGVPAIFVETSVNPDAVREIAREAGVRVGGELYSDSMGPLGSAGETYVGMMRENVIAIVTALGDPVTDTPHTAGMEQALLTEDVP